MAGTLQEILCAPDTEPRVIDDCCALIDQEIAEKSGISGNAVKLAYRTVATFASGYIRIMVASFLPGIVAQLEPFWADFSVSGGSSFGDYLAKRGSEVAEAVLSVTDERAESSQRATLIKTYRAVRGGAAKHVEAALPRVGELVLKYAA